MDSPSGKIILVTGAGIGSGRLRNRPGALRRRWDDGEDVAAHLTLAAGAKWRLGQPCSSHPPIVSRSARRG